MRLNITSAKVGMTDIFNTTGSQMTQKPEPVKVRAFCIWGRVLELPFCWRQIGTTAMCHLSRHADTFAQRRVRVNGFADIDCVCTHFNGQGNLANHVSCVGADHAADGKDCGTLVRIWLPLAITASN